MFDVWASCRHVGKATREAQSTAEPDDTDVLTLKKGQYLSYLVKEFCCRKSSLRKRAVSSTILSPSAKESCTTPVILPSDTSLFHGSDLTMPRLPLSLGCICLLQWSWECCTRQSALQDIQGNQSKADPF